MSAGVRHAYVYGLAEAYFVGQAIGISVILQAVSLSILLIPVVYWFLMNFRTEINGHNVSIIKSPSVTILLPMRNEEKNVIRKLESVISEIFEEDNANLLVIDSGSTDNTADIASGFLSDEFEEESRWEVVSWPEPGKSRAINRAVANIESEIVVMTDADADVSPGWLEIIIQRLSEKEIGVVSGLEDEDFSEIDKFNSYYRRKSNWLRIKESEFGSTPVLEGSIIAWDTEKIGKIQIDEGVNADDAQIGMISIRKGFRSIIDRRVSFHDFETKKRGIRESIRRSQGLSIVLLKNADLAFFPKAGGSRLAIINAISLYVIFPWVALIFSINSIIAFYHTPEISLNWPFFSILSVITVAIIPSGRVLLTGVIISLFAHFQAIVGKRYNVWNPSR